MRVMISQPMNGLTESQIKEAKYKAEEYLVSQGHVVIGTYFNDAWRNKEVMLERGVVHVPVAFLAMSIESMATCDAIYFIEGWEHARGCKLEHEVAKAYGLVMMYQAH